MKKIQPNSYSLKIVGGDLNTVLKHNKDRRGDHGKLINLRLRDTSLSNLMTLTDLSDG